MNDSLSNRIISSALRAFECNIKPNVLAIYIGYKTKCLHLIAYLSTQPSDEDHEMVSDITGEIICDFPDLFRTTKEECIFVSDINEIPIHELDCFIPIKSILKTN